MWHFHSHAFARTTPGVLSLHSMPGNGRFIPETLQSVTDRPRHGMRCIRHINDPSPAKRGIRIFLTLSSRALRSARKRWPWEIASPGRYEVFVPFNAVHALFSWYSSRTRRRTNDLPGHDAQDRKTSVCRSQRRERKTQSLFFFPQTVYVHTSGLGIPHRNTHEQNHNAWTSGMDRGYWYENKRER